MLKEIRKITDTIYTFFKRVMVGLPGQNIYMQARWRAALTNFLQVDRIALPPI